VLLALLLCEPHCLLYCDVLLQFVHCIRKRLADVINLQQLQQAEVLSPCGVSGVRVFDE
jgi:hypothetical protein